MKRDAGSIQRLAIHEVGHVAVGWSQAVVEVHDIRWSTHGFTFTSVSTESDWTDYERKVQVISGQVAVALGGGAAEAAVVDQLSPEQIAGLTLDDVIAYCGSIDLQLAQEWLALQRHDPSQDSIETEVHEVFCAVATELALDANRAAVRDLADTFLLARGEGSTDLILNFAESTLQAKCAKLHLSPRFSLRHTIAPNVVSVTTH